MLWLKAYPQASAELPGQWTLTTFPLYAVRASPHHHWHIYYYFLPLLPLLLILFRQSVSSATISCIILDCSAHGSRFNTCAALNNSLRILFSWTEQNCLFRWDHITCIWHHIWCFCDTEKHCFFFFFFCNIQFWENCQIRSEIVFFLCFIWTWMLSTSLSTLPGQKYVDTPMITPACSVIAGHLVPKPRTLICRYFSPNSSGKAFHKIFGGWLQRFAFILLQEH